MTGQAGATAAHARRNIVLLAIDAFHRVPPKNPRPIFVARVLVGADLVSLAGSVPSIGAAVITGAALESVLLAAFAVTIAVQLAMIRLGASLGAVAWSLVVAFGAIVVASSLTTRELQPQQPYWLVLLPLTAYVLAGPGPDDSRALRTPAPVAVMLFAVGLGILDVVAHQAGLTFNEPDDLTPAWAWVIDFVTFMAAASGLLAVYTVSVRETHAELRRLRRLLSVCAWCRKIRDEGEWIPLEQYIAARTRSDLTHGICPNCAETMIASVDDASISD